MEYSVNNKLYRVWDKENKRMIYIEGNCTDINRTYITIYEDGWKIEFDKTKDNVKCFLTNESGILMKYIGIDTCMFHKEIKPIFESDIVRHKNGYLYYVEWSPLNGWWCLVQLRIFVDDEYGCKRRPLEKVYTGGINGQDIKHCDIIGNIHQNPEIFKEKQ